MFTSFYSRYRKFLIGCALQSDKRLQTAQCISFVISGSTAYAATINENRNMNKISTTLYDSTPSPSYPKSQTMQKQVTKAIEILEKSSGNVTRSDASEKMRNEFNDSNILFASVLQKGHHPVEVHPEGRKVLRKPLYNPTIRAVLVTLEKLSCVVLIVSQSVSLAIFGIFRAFHFERLLHMGTEICLLIVHLLLLLFSDPDALTNTPEICKATAIAIQFFLIACFGCMAAEGFNSFCKTCNVISNKPLIPPIWNLLLVIAISCSSCILTAMWKYEAYAAELSCWANVEDSVILGTIIPIAILAWTGICFAEAGGMHRATKCPTQEKVAYYAAVMGLVWLTIKILLNLATGAIGAVALFYRNAALIGLASVLHSTLGCSMLFFHLSSNKEVFKFALKLWAKTKSACTSKFRKVQQ